MELEEDPQGLGDGEDDLTVRDLEEKRFPHSFAPLLQALGMAGRAEATGLARERQQKFPVAVRAKVMRFPDGTPKEILRLKELGWRYQIAWSADGMFIYSCDRPPAGESGHHLWRIPAEGGNPQDLGAVMSYVDGLSVHQDGLRITFSSWPINREPSKVWVMENFLPAASAAKK